MNGNIVRVVNIIYKNRQIENAIPDQQSLCTPTKFETYAGPLLHNLVISITQITFFFKESLVNCTKKQFLLSLAYVISIHRSQGLTNWKKLQLTSGYLNL